MAAKDYAAFFGVRVRRGDRPTIRFSAGNATLGAAPGKLGVSTRTLQRRIGQEGSCYQALLNGTRERLALHYMRNSSLPDAEIWFLLGYEDSNSFFRAFHTWTGATPDPCGAPRGSRRASV